MNYYQIEWLDHDDRPGDRKFGEWHMLAKYKAEFRPEWIAYRVIYKCEVLEYADPENVYGYAQDGDEQCA